MIRLLYTIETDKAPGYLKGFNVTGMEPYVDYFNFMSYDIHGTWDGKSKWTSSDVNSHTNLTGKDSHWHVLIGYCFSVS